MAFKRYSNGIGRHVSGIAMLLSTKFSSIIMHELNSISSSNPRANDSTTS